MRDPAEAVPVLPSPEQLESAIREVQTASAHKILDRYVTPLLCQAGMFVMFLVFLVLGIAILVAVWNVRLSRFLPSLLKNKNPSSSCCHPSGVGRPTRSTWCLQTGRSLPCFRRSGRGARRSRRPRPRR